MLTGQVPYKKNNPTKKQKLGLKKKQNIQSKYNKNCNEAKTESDTYVNSSVQGRQNSTSFFTVLFGNGYAEKKHKKTRRKNRRS